ncbi:formyltransferase family protein [Helicobacter sp. MIT 11-5569]|uniref:formyltransferase family protein n=1 Tax=Helicobacter sp. MIT 11-5569 TaxID=1548151 RepID=UPI001375D299|nr:formyltransferase family protein [Helicobacter sp. MIT 11-5569]
MIYSLPFVSRDEKVVLFSHRPKQSESVNAQEIAQKWKIPFKICQSDEEIDNECEIYLVTGCGILSNACLKGKKILNVHPGIIPNSRGLDSFKWAILKDKPLGVTLHYIDENVDCGEVVAVVPTPIYPSDSLQTLARRHYENEIAILANFEYHLQNPKNPFKDIDFCESTKRMQLLEEKTMLEYFNTYKEKMCKG